jgi:hypothetical protein
MKRAAVGILLASWFSGAGCGSVVSPAADGGAVAIDGGAPLADGGAGTGVDKAANCASVFGTAITAAYGRLDGTIRAVVPPAHPTCPRPNGDHLVLQVDALGAAYRMVLNVLSTRAGQDPRIAYLETPRALPAPAWSEGWHEAAKIDYVSTLGIHSTAFEPLEMAEVVRRTTDRLRVGARVSVYAGSSGGDSAHLIHRNGGGHDGAIVVDPDGASAVFLTFRFADQVF